MTRIAKDARPARRAHRGLRRRAFYAGAAAVAVAAAAAPARAGQPENAESEDGQQPVQQVQQGQARADSSRVEEIVVTARRREERLMDVPVSITAFSGDNLKDLGAINITDINERVPNVTFEVSRGTNTTLTPFIRGIGQQDPVAGFEQGVGVYIDGVYLNRPQGAVLDLYDVERVEVLRGPQGTLYGRNTIGGAIKYVTKRIEDEPTLDLEVTGGTFRQLDATANFGLPITENFKVGGTIASFNRDGFGDNINLGIENGSKDILAGRLSFEWTPSEDLFLRLSGDWTDDNSDPQQGHRLIPGQLSGAPVLDDVFNTRAGLNNPEASVVNRGLSLKVDWTINERFRLVNILAYRDNKSALPEDFDSLPVRDLDVAVRFADDQFTEELRLNYTGPDLNGTAGFFYMNATAFNEFDVILEPLGEVLGLPGFNSFTLGDVETDTWAVFGDVTYEITPEWEISAGVRFTSDERSSRIRSATFLNGFSPGLGGPERDPVAVDADFEGSETFEEATTRASLSWQPSREHNVYFTFSQGFKGGSFDPRGSGTAAPDLNGNGVAGPTDREDVKQFLQFAPEEVDNFELGYKGTLFDGAADLRLAGFWMDYENVQIPSSVGVDTDGDGQEDDFVGVTTNAGEARIRGIEMEGQAALARDMATGGDALRADWSVGFLDAEFQKFINQFGEDISDEANVQNAPEWTARASLSYSTPLDLFDSSGRLSLTPEATYRGDTSQFEVDSSGLDSDEYTLLNFHVVWTSNDETWRIGLHGRNLTDERYIVSGFDFVDDSTLDRPLASDTNVAPELGLEGTLTGFFGDPRTVSGTIAYSF